MFNNPMPQVLWLFATTLVKELCCAHNSIISLRVKWNYKQQLPSLHWKFLVNIKVFGLNYTPYHLIPLIRSTCSLTTYNPQHWCSDISSLILLQEQSMLPLLQSGAFCYSPPLLDTISKEVTEGCEARQLLWLYRLLLFFLPEVCCWFCGV